MKNEIHNPLIGPLDAGQIGACFVFGAILLLAMSIAENMFTESISEKAGLWATYFISVIGSGILFALGIIVGRQ